MNWKHYISLLLLCLSFAESWAQLPTRVRHENELFYIKPATDVFINGGLEHMEENIDNVILLQGNIHLTDSMVNNAHIYIFGNLPDTLGHVYFRGNSTQGFGGNSIVMASASFRNAYDTLALNIDTLFINHRLMLDSGNLFLDGNQLFLRRITYASSIIEGTIHGEDEDDNVYGFPGVVRMKRSLQTGTTFTNLHGTGLDLKNEGNLGSTVEIKRYNDEQSASNGSIKRFYTFNPAQSDDISNIGIEYLDPNDLNSNDENEFALYISHDNGLSYRDKAGSVNSGTNTLTNSSLFTISNQTRITLSEDSCDVLPEVNIPLDTMPLCDGTQVTITATGLSGMDVRWSDGQTNIDSITVDTAGLYWVRVENAQGCVNFDTVIIVDAPNPEVGFYSSFSCKGDSTAFTDTTTISSGEALSSAWAFGDPFTSNDYSTEANPKYKYTQFGTFQATLTVTSASGCTVSKQKSVVVLPNPVAQFTKTDVCDGAAVSFTNQSTVAGSAGLSYKWYFGDGDSAAISAPTHTYDSAGSYAVNLIATSNGCRDTIAKTVTIHPNPVALFSVNNVCAGTQTMLLNASSIDTGSLNYAWTMIGQTASTASNPIVTYSNPGTYTITLTATSDAGCIDAIIDSIIINPVPTADFTFNNVCESDSTVFTNASALSSGSMNYTWSFGSTSASPTHLFGNDGTYNVTLTVQSDSGCMDDIAKTVTVYANPLAAFSFSNVCDGAVMSFQNGTSIPSGTLSYAWDFAGEAIASTANAQHTFAQSGLFDVQLIATTALGCQDSITQQVEVYDLPEVYLGADTLNTCGSSLVLDAQNAGSSFSWSNGATAQIITALSNGFYRVTVTDGNNCASADTTYVQLFTAINPNLGPNKVVCDSVLLLSGYPSANTQFVWSNGATTNNAWATSSGQYEVTVTDQNGCTGSDTVLVTVNASPVVDLGADQTACNGQTITFDAGNSGSTYSWSNGANTQTINIQNSGNYTVTVTTPQNCSKSDVAHASFQSLPSFTLGADRAACDSTVLSANISGATYAWSNGASTNSVYATTSGIYSLTTSFASGCEFSDTVQITINETPQVNLGADQTICADQNVTLDAGFAGNSYMWNTGETTQTIVAAQSGNFNVTVTTAQGCAGTDQVNITKNAALAVDLGANFILCDSAQKTLDAGIANATYTWTGQFGFTGTTQAVTVSDSGWYAVAVLDQFGCVGSDSVFATASNASLNAAFLARTTIQLGDTIQFINLSEPTGFTSYWNMGDGFTTSANNPTHPYFVSDSYEVMLAVSNGVCADTIYKTISIEALKTEAIAHAQTLATYEGFLSSALYPNPNRGTFVVEVELENESELIMDIYNMQGALIDHQTGFGYNIRKEFSYQHLPSGMYFVRCHNTKAVQSLKFIVLE